MFIAPTSLMEVGRNTKALGRKLHAVLAVVDNRRRHQLVEFLGRIGSGPLAIRTYPGNLLLASIPHAIDKIFPGKPAIVSIGCLMLKRATAGSRRTTFKRKLVRTISLAGDHRLLRGQLLAPASTVKAALAQMDRTHTNISAGDCWCHSARPQCAGILLVVSTCTAMATIAFACWTDLVVTC